MSSRSRPSLAAALALIVALALPGVVAHAAHRVQQSRGLTPEKLPPAADDSSRSAHEMLTLVRGIYGGQDNWANIEGWRYYVTYRLFGPDSTKVGEWTEAHLVWAKDSPRIRIDNANDSTVVVVTGDTTYVRRGGVWSTDSSVVAQARALALQNVWLLRMPWNLLDFSLVRRLDPPYVKDGPLSVRIDFGPGQDQPAGTRAWIRFEPPSYAIRSVRWFDPKAKGWYLLEYSGDQQRYGWTWAGRRTLRATDSEGRPGPVIMEALIEDMQVDNEMPLNVLSPPGGVPVRATPHAAAPDSARTR